MLLRTKNSKIMHLIHFLTVMLQSHYTCQQSNFRKLYINYMFMIVAKDFSRVYLISLVVNTNLNLKYFVNPKNIINSVIY